MEGQLRKRLRKKRRLAEFREYGFSVLYQLEPGADPGAADAFLDRFVESAVEANGLLCGGGGGPVQFDFFVVGQTRLGASESQRQRLQEWLFRQPEVAVQKVGELEDAWHGPLSSLEEEAPAPAGRLTRSRSA
jgi:uncharacterized protein YggL (DUF469 family)